MPPHATEDKAHKAQPTTVNTGMIAVGGLALTAIVALFVGGLRLRRASVSARLKWERAAFFLGVNKGRGF